LAPLKSSLIFSLRVQSFCAKFETSRWEIAKKTIVSWTAMVIPDEPLHAAPCATMHCGGSPNGIVRPLMGMVIEVQDREPWKSEQ
jgi:hypothetical protein